jgi:hypothetical protein
MRFSRILGKGASEPVFNPFQYCHERIVKATSISSKPRSGFMPEEPLLSNYP